MSASWTPPDNQQKVSVTVGSSMLRALNARKSGGAPRNSVPLREYYSFRYNFKPPSVDPDKRGRITVGPNSNVAVERPSSQSSEAHKWTGQEAPAKEWDCILIYDENQKSFILEKLESGLALTHQPRTGANDLTTPAEVPAKHTKAHADDDFEQELLDAAAVRPNVIAEGEDDYFDEIVPKDSREKEEEEEEGEVLPSPPPPSVKKQARKPTTTPTTKPSAKPFKPTPTPTPAPASSKASKPALPPPSSAPLPTPSRAVKPTTMAPPPSAPAAPTLKPQTKLVSLPRGKKHKREPEPAPVPVQVPAPATTPDSAPAPPASVSTVASHFSDADEEDLQFGKPTKRARPSRGPGLALPGASTAAFIPPPPPPHAPAAAPSIAVSEPNEVEVGSESEDEGGWDEVAAIDSAVDTKDNFDIFREASGAADDAEGEDIGMDEFEREINSNLHMTEEEEEEDDEDFLAAVVEKVPPSHGQPMSLKEMAGDAVYVSDDEYSSSEESDDD